MRLLLGSAVCVWVALGAQTAETRSAETMFRNAAAALSTQDYASAEQGFLQVLKLEPKNIGALGNLGVVYSKTRRYGQAVDAYQRALRLAPGEKFLTTNLGLAYIKQEKYSAALPLFDKLAAAEPSNRQALEMVATCRVALGQSEAGLKIVDQLLPDDPTNAGLLYLQGVALTRLKRTEEAHATYARMMEATSPAQAYFLMGKASYETGLFPEAVDAFQRSLAADPSLEGTHRELGKAYISLREDAKAEAELRLAGKDDAEAVYFLGALLSRSRPAEAIPLLESALKLDSGFWGPLYYLGRIHMENKEWQRALPLLERAAKLNPEEAAIQYQLGRALNAAGRQAEGRAALAKFQALKQRSLRKEEDLLLSPHR